MSDFGAFDTETINRPLHGEACLLIKKLPDKAVEMLEFPKTFDDIFDFLKGHRWVCWNMDFDARAILHPVFTDWEHILTLGEKESTTWGKYSLKYIAGKQLTIGRNGSSITLFDLRQFFGMGLAKASAKYLGEGQRKAEIPKAWYGRVDHILRSSGYQREVLLKYASQDVIALEGLLKLTLASYQKAGLTPRRLTSPASLSAQYYRPKWPYKGRVPDGVNRAFQRAFYGGRIEVFKLGRIEGPLYLYDIHSAYPAEVAKLCPFDFRLFSRPISGPSYSCHFIRVKVPHTWQVGPTAVRHDNTVIYPTGEFKTWVGGDMLKYLRELGLRPEILESWYVPIVGGPIWAEETQKLYDDRKDPVSGLAMKLVMNSWYGKLCEQSGRVEGGRYNCYGRYCAFPWAMTITERTRIKLDRAMRGFNGKVVFGATDGILVRGEWGGPELNPRMGEWGREGPYSSAVVLGCGRYFLHGGPDIESKSHMRGFPADYPEEKLMACKARRKKIKMLETLSVKEWYKANALPDFNVLADIGRDLTIEDNKRHWPVMPRRISDAWASSYSSQTLILG